MADDKKYIGAYTGAQIDEAVDKALNGTLMNAKTYDPQGKAQDIFQYVDDNKTSGVHVGPDAPTDANANFWVDVDDTSAPIKYKNPDTGEWEAIEISSGGSEPGLRMDLLWTNPDPTVAFSAQVIELNTAGYDGLLYTFYGRANDLDANCIPDVLNMTIGSFRSPTMINTGQIYTRSLWWKSETEIEFYDCFAYPTYGTATGRNTLNEEIIPHRIFGIRNTSTSNPVCSGTTESINHPGCFYRMVNGVQEWLNPPMELGVEYKTTERHLGKPVYVKVVDCGNGPNAGRKDVQFISNSSDIKAVVSMDGYWDSGNFLMTPVFYNGDETTYMFISGQNIVIYATTADRSNSHFYALVKYTKTTD